MSAPKIILYTSRLCPWAHRAHIALKESGLEYEEVTIDLGKPREPWYLEVNPVSDPRPYQILSPSTRLTPAARPRPQFILQRRDNHRVGHCRAVHRRRPPIPPPARIGPGRQRPLPRPPRLLCGRVLQQGPTTLVQQYQISH